MGMIRLTARDNHRHAYYPKCFEHPCDGERKCCTYTAFECDFEGEILRRLAAYEDTELSPGDIEKMRSNYETLKRGATWIKVEDEMPDPFETVMITAKMDSDKMPLTYEGAYTGLGTWELYGVQNPGDYRVSAWMPLPEPYTEIEERN